MSESYLSWNGARLEAPWQGIERVSIDFNVPGFAAVVTAHLALPANGMTVGSVAVRGGRRITDLVPEIVVVNATDTIELRFAERGDRADYFICLRDGGADPVHPFFAEGRFNFFVDCAAGDCRPRDLLSSLAPGPSPSVDLSQKDYPGFVRMLSEWVRVHNPDWADLAPASLERVLVELLAHHADMLSYYQDRVANEAFIDTAQQRYSLRQHGALLGYPVDDGESGTTTLSFQVENAGFVPAGPRLVWSDNAKGYEPVGFAAEMPRQPGERQVVFRVLDRVRVSPLNNAHVPSDPMTPHLQPAAWPGAEDAVIPLGATRMLLWSHDNALEPGARLGITQGSFWQIVTLDSVRPIQAPGWTDSPASPLASASADVTEITWLEPLQRALVPWADETVPLRLHGNLAEAAHGDEHRFVIPSSSATSNQDDVVLHRQNHIAVEQLFGDGQSRRLLRALRLPEVPVVFQRAGDGRVGPVLELVTDESTPSSNATWTREEHLFNSRSFDRHFVATTDNQGAVWIEFGDGVHGRAVELAEDSNAPLERIQVNYWTGESADANCALHTLTQVALPIPKTTAALGQIAVTNVRPSAGRRPASLDAIRRDIPNSLRHGELQRAVSLADYAAIAKQVDGVARAAARAVGGVFNTVIVLVDPQGQADLTPELAERVRKHVDERRMAGREHFVRAAQYVPLDVSLLLCIEPGFLRHEVRDRVLAELRPGSDRRPGYFHPDKLSFDQEIELGDVLAFVQRIAGVRAVKAEAFRKLAQLGPQVVDRIDLGTYEVARLDADDNFPEFGKLQVRAVGLDEIDESLFQDAGPVTAGGEA